MNWDMTKSIIALKFKGCRKLPKTMRGSTTESTWSHVQRQDGWKQQTHPEMGRMLSGSAEGPAANHQDPLPSSKDRVPTPQQGIGLVNRPEAARVTSMGSLRAGRFCCPFTWKAAGLSFLQADLGSDLWPEGRGGCVIWDRAGLKALRQIWVYLWWSHSLVPPLCYPPHPAAARDAQGQAFSRQPFLLSSKQRVSQGDQLIPKVILPSTNAWQCAGAETPAQEEGTRRHTEESLVSVGDAMFPFFTSDPVFCSIFILSKGPGRLGMTCNYKFVLVF